MITAIGNCESSSLKPEKQMKLLYSGFAMAPIIKIAYDLSTIILIYQKQSFSR